jgi:translation initiation factor IF-2
MADSIYYYQKNQASSAQKAILRSTLDSLRPGSFVDTREVLKVPVIIKADLVGSLEAVKAVLSNITMSDEHTICHLDLISTGLGDVTLSDVTLAAASKAKIIAFNVNTAHNVKDYIKDGQYVDISYHKVIYHMIDEMKELVKTTFAPPPPGQYMGTAECKKIFNIGKVGKIAGSVVTDGKIIKNSNVRVLRQKKVVFTGAIATLKILKDKVEEVPTDSECGIQLEGFEDLMEGDIIQCYLVGQQKKDDDENGNDDDYEDD